MVFMVALFSLLALFYAKAKLLDVDPLQVHGRVFNEMKLKM